MGPAAVRGLTLVLCTLSLCAGCMGFDRSHTRVEVPESFAKTKPADRVRVGCESTRAIALLEGTRAVLPVPLDDKRSVARLLEVREAVHSHGSMSWWRIIGANVFMPIGGLKIFATYKGSVELTYRLERLRPKRDFTYRVRADFEYLDYAWLDEDPRHYPLNRLIAWARREASLKLLPQLLRDLKVKDADLIRVTPRKP